MIVHSEFSCGVSKKWLVTNDKKCGNDLGIRRWQQVNIIVAEIALLR
jgi:hypothetical protein